MIVRLGWAGAMRDLSDPGSNATAYTRAAAQIAHAVRALPLPPPALLPLLLHAGNELNACNEWHCSDAPNVTMTGEEMAMEVAAFARDVAISLIPLRNGSVRSVLATDK